MTKTIKRLLPAALAVLLAGCAMQPVDSTTARYRVALVAKNNRDSEFWDAVFTGAEAAATEYNLQLTITAPDDEEDYAAQNQLIADAVEDGAQAIVFSAIDYEANAAAIDAAAAAGGDGHQRGFCGELRQRCGLHRRGQLRRRPDGGPERTGRHSRDALRRAYQL